MSQSNSNPPHSARSSSKVKTISIAPTPESCKAFNEPGVWYEMNTMRLSLFLAFLPLLLLATGCSSTMQKPLPSPSQVDLARFMGTWYVLGYTPILVDKQAHNAVEHYAQHEDGRILTTYQFRKGAADGPLKTFQPTGFIANQDSKAEWKMQFVWPFKADYVILYLSEDYDRTIVVHPNRKYAWIMQRSPVRDETTYAEMLELLATNGFDLEAIQPVPHDWSNEQDRLRIIEAAGSTKPLIPR